MNIKVKVKVTTIVLAALVTPLGILADNVSDKLVMPAIFADNMVLQRDIACNIWGKGKPGTIITVSFDGQQKTATVTPDGNWSLKLDAMDVFSEGKELSVKDGSSERVFKNVVVGDVWVCSGQSNMLVGIERLRQATPELWKHVVETNDYPNVRYMSVQEVKSPFKENADIRAGRSWTPLGKNVDLYSLRPSGIGYIFATRLHRELKIPIGFVVSAIGGSPAETWMSNETLISNATGKLIADSWAQVQMNYSEEKVKEYVDEQISKAKASGNEKLVERLKNRNHWPKEPITSRLHPCSGFNGMIAPITKYSVKGIIWDQGETNTGRAWQYRILLPLVISDWRRYWKQGNGDMAAQLPFYQVQIQDLRSPLDRSKQPPSAASPEAEIRDAQRFVADNTDHCEIACTIDHHEKGDTHPLQKHIPGERLVAIALAKTYGRDIQWRGPTLKSSKVEGNTIHVSFDGVGQGLMTGRRTGHNLKADPVDEALDYFAIAGEDKIFVWAKAKIKGDTVVVWSDRIKAPKYVRYAWEANPDGCNLYNKDGWPATPFRTDDLPYVTKGNQEPLKKTDYFVHH